MKKYFRYGLLVILTGCIFFGIWLCFPAIAAENVVINEVCSSNFSLIADEGGNYPDYVELYNPGSVAVSLEGFYLADREGVQDGAAFEGGAGGNLAHQYALDHITIPAKGYALIWMDGSGAEEHAPFALSKDGDELYLVSALNGTVVDSVRIPALSYNTVYGRRADGAEEWALMTATAGSANAAAVLLAEESLEEPLFSAESGFYEESFLLTITAEENQTIYYTLDGREPDTQDMVYEGPILIEDASGRENLYAARTDLAPSGNYVPEFKVDKATVVRAICYDEENHACSPVVTKVYFVGYENREEYDGMAILALTADADALFDPESGIYGNGVAFEEYKNAGGLQDGEVVSQFTDENGIVRYRYTASNAFNKGKEWEREATVTFFDEGHSYCFSQNVGIRIAGESTRGAAQKSMSIYGREIYDDIAEFPYAFFEGTSYSTIKLRNGGSDHEKSKIMDAFLEQLCLERDVSVQRSSPCVVFLNGEYWGIYNIRERYQEEYLREHYGVAAENAWIVDCGQSAAGSDAAQSAYDGAVDFVAGCDMTDEALYRTAESLWDFQSLLDFYCINLYVDNIDVSFSRNIALWRAGQQTDSEYGDGRWRFMLLDMDGALNSWDSNTFQTSMWWDEQADLMDEPVIAGLLKNPEFKKRFCLTFMDIANTVFSYDRVHESLMEWMALYETQAVKSHQRFISDEIDETVYEEYIMEMDDFFKNRFSFITECLKSELGLDGSLVPVTVGIDGADGGYVRVNTAEISGEQWTGMYYTDYPVTLEAVAADGYRFAGWETEDGFGDVLEADGEDGSSITVFLSQGGTALTARFEKIGNEGNAE